VARPGNVHVIRTLLSQLLKPNVPSAFKIFPPVGRQALPPRLVPKLSIRPLATSGPCEAAPSCVGTPQRKEKVVILTGATASGKTKASIELAQRIGGEIISADSVQVYKGLDVGSDKVNIRPNLGLLSSDSNGLLARQD